PLPVMAARTPAGRLACVLVNRSAEEPRRVDLPAGYALAEVWRTTSRQDCVKIENPSGGALELPPESLTTLVLTAL
ncbi:MAG: hypothetical protein AAF790_11735, partial [Planctomycetota bacterium]